MTSTSIIEGLGAHKWYPGDKQKLEKEIKSYLEKVSSSSSSLDIRKTLGLIAPHAGLGYSGPVAAFAYNKIAGQHYKTVIVMGPSHTLSLRDQILIPDPEKLSSYKTPYGTTELNHQGLKDLLKDNNFFKKEAQANPFASEHSIDNQIPFIQYQLGAEKFKLIPMIIGQFSSASKIREVAAFIRSRLLDDETLLIVSSDFTHFGPQFSYIPFKNDIEANLQKMDLTAAQLITFGQGMLDDFIEYQVQTKATICGENAIAILMSMLPSSLSGEILKYDTSGRMTGDFSNTVSYVAMSFSGSWKEIPLEALREEEEKDLLKLARFTIENYLNKGQLLSASQVATESGLNLKITPLMLQRSGAFVTLKQKKTHELRGCIGEIYPERPLIDVIHTRALDAAFNDGRFNPLRDKSELAQIEIELSLLSPPVLIPSYQHIVLGKHGIILSKNKKSALFLPQVATEQKWDLATTLSALCEKAGLKSNDWKEGAIFQVFEAKIIHEK